MYQFVFGCVCENVFLSASLCIISAPACPKPLMLTQEPRTISTSLFVCSGCCHHNCTTFDPHLYQTWMLHTCWVSVETAALPWKPTYTHIWGGLKTVSNYGILLILACNLISMPNTHSRAACLVLTHTDTHMHTHLFILTVSLNVPWFMIVGHCRARNVGDACIMWWVLSSHYWSLIRSVGEMARCSICVNPPPKEKEKPRWLEVSILGSFLLRYDWREMQSLSFHQRMNWWII